MFHDGLFQFMCLLSGLKNAPTTFQRIMDVILGTVKWQFALFYFDEIIFFLNTVSEQVEQVRQALQLLSENVVTLKLKKCSCFTETIEYSGSSSAPL